jgi:phosphoribosylformylglycinamidine synthase
MAFAGGLGLSLDLARVPCAELPAGYDPDSTRLFSESCTRFLVEVRPADQRAFERHFRGLDCAEVGAVRAEPRLRIQGQAGAILVDLDLESLRAAHQGGFQG